VLGIYPASTEAGHYANLKGNALLKYAEGNCIGTLFFGVEIGLLDDDGKEVPMGEVGRNIRPQLVPIRRLLRRSGVDGQHSAGGVRCRTTP